MTHTSSDSIFENMEQLIHDMFVNLNQLNYVKPTELPNVSLYMDQLTTFMDTHLSKNKRYCDDKVLTKTMINNYTKNHLLPPSDRKKYSKDHMLLLIFIYYFKNFLSINDIQTLLTPITEHYFQSTEAPISLDEIYNEVFGMEKQQLEVLSEDITDKIALAKETFANVPEKDREYLTTFSLICMLSFDIYVKKQLVERMIDQLNPPAPEGKKGKK